MINTKYLLVTALALGSAVVYLNSLYAALNPKAPILSSNIPANDEPQIPKYNFPIIGLVFYGRKQFFEITNHYVNKNLRVNGGLLDKVMFCINTNVTSDLAYLDELTEKTPQYEKVLVGGSLPPGATTYGECYRLCKEANAIYIKIDDDVVYIRDGAIEALVKEKLKNRYLFVSGNIVNHPRLGHVHQQIGAIMDYKQVAGQRPWIKATEPYTSRFHKVFEDDPFGQCSWKSWECAAIAHENFLDAIETNTIDRFDFKYYDYHAVRYLRWSINFFAFTLEDFAKLDWSKLYANDEEYLSETYPSDVKKHCVAVGEAVAAHFSFFTQKAGLMSRTNLLDRYRALVYNTTTNKP